VGDSEFQVYGITDDSFDDWSSETMDWESAPANDLSNGTGLLPETATLLGSFQLPQGIQSGTFGIRGDALKQFLKADSNQRATLVVVRTTMENRGGGIVHAFASARHSGLPAPSLSVKLR